MAPFAADRFGNAVRCHRAAREARTALEDARDEVAALLGAAPGEVVFTGGRHRGRQPRRPRDARARAAATGRRPGVVCSAVEHAAVLRAAPRPAAAASSGRRGRAAERAGRRRRRGRPGRAGRAFSVDDVALVSVMLANNEVGHGPAARPTSSPSVRERAPPGARLTPTPCRRPRASTWPTAAAGADLVSRQRAQARRPEGRRALLVGPRGRAAARRCYGGGQERERRSGTHDVAGAVGLAAALRLAVAVAGTRRAPGRPRLRDRLADGLLAAVAGRRRERARGVACCRATATCASPASSRRSCSCSSTRPGSAPRPVRPAPAARSSRATCSLAMGVARRPRRGARSASPSGHDDRRRRRPRPWRWCRRRSSACGADAAAIGPRAAGGRLRPCGCSWPCRAASTRRSRRRCSSRQGHDVVGAHPQAVGRPVGLGLLLGRRRRRRPPGGPAARHRPPRLRPDRGVRGGGRRPLRRRARGRRGRRTPASSATGTIKFDRLLDRARPARASTPWRPAITPGWPATARRRRSCGGVPTPTRTSPTCCRCSARTSWPACVLPVGELTKAEVRAHAAALGLRTAAKPDSQDVCFIAAREGRRGFLGERLALHPGRRSSTRERRGGRAGRRRRARDRRAAARDGPRQPTGRAATWSGVDVAARPGARRGAGDGGGVDSGRARCPTR